VAGVLTLASVVIGVLGLALDLLRVGTIALFGVLLGLLLAHTACVILLQRRIAAGVARDTALDDMATAESEPSPAEKWARSANTGTAKG